MSLSVRVARGTYRGRPIRHMGDPGLGSWLTGAASKVGGAVVGAVTRVLGGGGSQPMPGGVNPIPVSLPGVPAIARPNPITGQIPTPGTVGLPGIVQMNLPGFGQPGTGISIGSMQPINTNAVQQLAVPPKGYRLNKTGYYVQGGQYVAPGTRYVKIRRRNSLNPRALSRSIARIEGAKKASKIISRISVRPRKC